MPEIDAEDISRAEKIAALRSAWRFNPGFIVMLVLLGIVVAVLEGVGLTFIIPIIEILQVSDPAAEATGVMAVFVSVYQLLGVPLSLGFVIGGVAAVMTLRYTATFVLGWFRKKLRYEYKSHLQKQAFDRALDARLGYFDREGSDEILNAIITESSAASRVINKIVKLSKLVFLVTVYLAIALWISPLLTVIAIGILGAITVVMRNIVEPGYKVGDLVADANKQRQQHAQAGMVGIRDIKLFNLNGEISGKFVDAIDQYTVNKIKLGRNESAINNFYNLAVALFVFVLIYISLALANLSFGELGLFLFLMFQLGPKVSGINEKIYQIENELPHLVRTQRFQQELDSVKEPTGGDRSVPQEVRTIEFDDVHFSYGDEEDVLKGVNFSIRKGELVGFVGQSGAGKSTIVSLLARYYEPDRGRIRANGDPIDEMDPKEWRDRLAFVRQDPYVFNETLRYNLTIGNRDATQAEIDDACRIAQVDEFFDDLPNGYDSQLGDEGVRLSGGQKQRVALARALLKDADLLLLDEATSDLDSNLEKRVQQGIERMDRDYAIVTIAHRLSTVENADRIYTMEDGRITETGDHAELIDENGKYAELYAIQAG